MREVIMVCLLILSGCCEKIVDPPKPAQTRFVEENSSGLPFSLYRDTKTGRLYANTVYGGLCEINDEPSQYEQNVEKKR